MRRAAAHYAEGTYEVVTMAFGKKVLPTRGSTRYTVISLWVLQKPEATEELLVSRTAPLVSDGEFSSRLIVSLMPMTSTPRL